MLRYASILRAHRSRLQSASMVTDLESASSTTKPLIIPKPEPGTMDNGEEFVEHQPPSKLMNELHSPKPEPGTMENGQEFLEHQPPSKLMAGLHSPKPEPGTMDNGQEFVEQQPPSKLKGELHSLRCGICGTKEGNSTRGIIDSCDHYFCFVCILEWSGTKTKCPVCQISFTNIYRPSKSIFNVHKGNQVNHPNRNASVVECSVCHGNDDEIYVLICDLCDLFAHTYCVGLGVTVPEGVWFCKDCDRSLPDSHKRHVSIYEIVHEKFNCSTAHKLFPSQDSSLPNQPPVVVPAGKPTKLGPRMLHSRLRALRKNWNGLRNGSLSFGSKPVESGGESGKKSKVSAGAEDVYRDTHDTVKAWRMMKMAKLSMQRDCERANSAHQATVSKQASNNTSSSVDIVKRHPPGSSSDLGGKMKKRTSPESKIENHGFLESKRQKQVKVMTAEESCEERSQRLRKDDDTKSEIQSLVKLNLKLLRGDKRLGFDMFKEVARVSTHTILAACGLEHRKFGNHLFAGSVVCSHTEQEHDQQLHKSTLMPNSCRECFYIFVKNVVHSIMFEKVDHARGC